MVYKYIVEFDRKTKHDIFGELYLFEIYHEEQIYNILVKSFENGILEIYIPSKEDLSKYAEKLLMYFDYRSNLIYTLQQTFRKTELLNVVGLKILNSGKVFEFENHSDLKLEDILDFLDQNRFVE